MNWVSQGSEGRGRTGCGDEQLQDKHKSGKEPGRQWSMQVLWMG